MGMDTNQPKPLRIVSQAQFQFFTRKLDEMNRKGLETDPSTGIDKFMIMAALKAAGDPKRLPVKAGMPAPQPKPQAPQPLTLKPSEWGTISTVLSAHRVNLSPEQRAAIHSLGYFVNAPGMGFLALVQTPQKRTRLRQLFPSVQTVWTFKEVMSFLELGDEKVKSLKQAAELLASPAPPEARPPSPPMRFARDEWRDTDGDEDWSVA
jgi:hypothetical protein